MQVSTNFCICSYLLLIYLKFDRPYYTFKIKWLKVLRYINEINWCLWKQQYICTLRFQSWFFIIASLSYLLLVCIIIKLLLSSNRQFLTDSNLLLCSFWFVKKLMLCISWSITLKIIDTMSLLRCFALNNFFLFVNNAKDWKI